MTDRDAATPTAALAGAARRLTGIDASRSGLGGYRWQLELALLRAAAAGASSRHSTVATPVPGPAPAARPVRRPAAGTPPPQRAPDAAPAPAAQPRAGRRRPLATRLVPRPVAPAEPRRRRHAVRATARAACPTTCSRTSRVAGPRSSPGSAATPPTSRWWPTAGPSRSGTAFVILGFPEDQPFLREKAEQRRKASRGRPRPRPRPPVGVRCVVANVELADSQATDDGLDLVAQARSVFGGDLADVDDIG